MVMFQHITFSFLTTVSIMALLHWKWDSIVAYLGADPYLYRILLSHVFVTSLYFAIGSLFVVMDLTLSPKALRKYKTQVVQCANELNRFQTHFGEDQSHSNVDLVGYDIALVVRSFKCSCNRHFEPIR